MAQYRRLAEILKQAGTVEIARGRLRAYMQSEGFGRSEIRQNIEMWVTDWGLAYARYDPLAALKGYRGPVLALYGANDLQVSAKENAPVMRAALRHPASEVVVFSGLNHLFQPSDTGKVEDYAFIDTTIDPQVLAKIAVWLQGL